MISCLTQLLQADALPHPTKRRRVTNPPVFVANTANTVLLPPSTVQQQRAAAVAAFDAAEQTLQQQLASVSAPPLPIVQMEREAAAAAFDAAERVHAAAERSAVLYPKTTTPNVRSNVRVRCDTCLHVFYDKSSFNRHHKTMHAPQARGTLTSQQPSFSFVVRE